MLVATSIPGTKPLKKIIPIQAMINTLEVDVEYSIISQVQDH